jgi:Kef-type K+ transport system membrane component KefB
MSAAMESSPAPLLTSLLLLLVAARLLGELMKRWKQPALVGEMLAGILLGPAVLDAVRPSLPLDGVTELAMFFIVLGAGMELKPGHILRGLTGRGAWTSILNFAVPMGLGLLLASHFEMDPRRSIFLGLCISITALPVAVRILEQFGLLDSLTARLGLSAAVASDAAALLILGVILELPPQPGFAAIAGAIGAGLLNLAGLAALLAAAYFILRRLGRWGMSVPRGLDRVRDLFGKEALFGLAAVFVLVFSSVSEGLGFHAVVGAFFGAMLLSSDLLGQKHYQSVQDTLKGIGGGFLAPLFFASLGLHFSTQAFQQPQLLASVLLVAVLSKTLAGWLGGRLAGMGSAEAWGLGAILNGRGVMELVVAQIALRHGFIEPGLCSILVLMGVVTTLLSPLMYRWMTGSAPAPRRPKPA